MSDALVVLGTAPSDAGAPGTAASAAADLLAGAGTVFVFPQAESTALFYAEAWRVERVVPRDAVARIAARCGGGPAVLLVEGDPAADPALGSVLDGLSRAVPGLVVTTPGTRVAPPHRSPLIG
ncbi:hypothetical protein [Pseudonocardia spirodelae]|uniref:Uncharacterized protein n=1 Tax=Pseudonocardia spirodelae TaxID=3133431 RepID=A0ABU8T795_9PSEU